MSSLIAEENILIHGRAADWREAVRLAGGLLVASHCITTQYVEDMIQAVVDMGPYMVILPGFALAHAAPSPSVLKNGMSLVTLETPVEFGAKENDPVRVVLCISCVDRGAHMDALKRVATMLMEDGMVDRIAAASTKEALLQLMESY